jgi:hypothetical protein
VYISKVKEFQRSHVINVSNVTLIADARMSAQIDLTATGLTSFSLHAHHSRFDPLWRDGILSIPKFNFSGHNALKNIEMLLHTSTDYDSFSFALRDIVGK